jgi:hypothetical protein
MEVTSISMIKLPAWRVKVSKTYRPSFIVGLKAMGQSRVFNPISTPNKNSSYLLSMHYSCLGLPIRPRNSLKLRFYRRL